MDRADLAVDALTWAGNFPHVETLLASNSAAAPWAAHGGDAKMAVMWDRLGNHWLQHWDLDRAVACFAQSRNVDMLARCFAALGDVHGLARLVAVLPMTAAYAPDKIDALSEQTTASKGADSLALRLGNLLQLAGHCDTAVQAYLKGGHRDAAVHCCITLQQWQQAVALSEVPTDTAANVDALVHTAAQQLSEAGRLQDAVQLLHKAGRHLDAARMILAALQHQPMREVVVSCMGVVYTVHDGLMCLYIHKHHAQCTLHDPASAKALYCQAALAVLRAGHTNTPTDPVPAGLLSTCWHGALGAHWLCTGTAALHAGQVDVAVRAALLATHCTVCCGCVAGVVCNHTVLFCWWWMSYRMLLPPSSLRTQTHKTQQTHRTCSHPSTSTNSCIQQQSRASIIALHPRPCCASNPTWTLKLLLLLSAVHV